jgi:hypothetical protein
VQVPGAVIIIDINGAYSRVRRSQYKKIRTLRAVAK